MDLSIDDNSAVVTASSSGLGKASAKALAKNGVNVVINGRNSERLDEAVADIESIASNSVVGQAADLTDPDDISELINRAVDEFGGLDHLVVNSGGPPGGPFLETTDKDWYEAFDLLVMSAVRAVREAADPLREGDGGSMVMITSRSVKESIDSLVLSNSVRMSVIGLEKTLSRELAPEVRANAVLPGPHETSRQKELIQKGVDRGEYESYEEGLDARGGGSPLNRMGNPMELGDTVAFLCSERASYINGAAIPVDGGLLKANL